MKKEREIVFSTDRHFIVSTPRGFEVYRNEFTHAVCCAQVGYKGQEGLDKAKQEIERREKDGTR